MQFMRGRFDLAAPRIRYRVERACISFGSSVSLILQPANTSIPINWFMKSCHAVGHESARYELKKEEEEETWCVA